MYFASQDTTLLNVMRWDSTIFDNIPLPDGVENDMVVDAILDRCGLCGMLYPESDFLKAKNTSWFKKHLDSFTKMFATLSYEYNPIWDYDMYLEYHKDTIDDEHTDTAFDQTDTFAGNEVSTDDATTDYTSNTDFTSTETYSDTKNSTEDSTTNSTENVATSANSETENTVSAYNAATYQPDNKVEGTSGSSTETIGKVVGNVVGKVTDASTKNVKSNTDVTDKTVYDDDATKKTDNLDVIDADTAEQRNLDRDEDYSDHNYGRKGAAQDLIEKERELAKFVFYDWIARLWEIDFCVTVY